MAKYPSITLTNAGLNMIAQSQGGTSLIFTKIQLGDGTVASGQDLKALTALIEPLLTANISSIDTTTTAGQATLTTVISNIAVTTGFFARELGVFAKVGSSGAEQLFAYTNAGNYADYMPDSSTPINENQIKITLVVGNASSVSAVINGSIVYTTLAQVDAEITTHNNDPTAHGLLAALYLWQKGNTYVVGDICNPHTIGNNYKYFECTVAGTSGTIEPTWPAVGQTITDGTVQWTVRDLRQGSAQFDNSTKLATTAFVKKAGVNYSGHYAFNSNTTLTASHAGSMVFGSAASPFTITLPLTNACPAGTTITIMSTGSGVLTIARQGTDSIAAYSGSVNAINLNNGDTLTLESNGLGLWFAIGGSAQLGYAGIFGALLSTAGYQKLPSGLIIQWFSFGAIVAASTISVSLPITFPTATLNVIATPVGYSQGTVEVCSVSKNSLVLGEGGSGRGISAGFAIAIGF